MSKNMILYEVPASPPVRAVKMLAKALDLNLELKTVNLMNKEQYSEDYLQMNPAHTVPTLDDNGYVLWDSHAIMIYLMEKYAKNDSLYPNDLEKRSQINQFLFFDASVFSKLFGIMIPIFYDGVKEITEANKAFMMDSYDSAERLLNGKSYLSGSEPSIADISLVTTITSSNFLIPVDPVKYPNVTSWFKRMEGLPYYGPNAEGVQAHKSLIQNLFPFLNIL